MEAALFQVVLAQSQAERVWEEPQEKVRDQFLS